MAPAKGLEMVSVYGVSMRSGVIGVEDRLKNASLDGVRKKEDGSQNNCETVSENP